MKRKGHWFRNFSWIGLVRERKNFALIFLIILVLLGLAFVVNFSFPFFNFAFSN